MRIVVLKDKETQKMEEQTEQGALVELTADIVSAYVSNNTMVPADLPGMIDDIYEALSRAAAKAALPVKEELKPAVSDKKSITPDYLICLEDGKKLKMLKRHLKTAYNMTPEEYRERWGLAADYPMVAPNYAKKRSSLAKKIGLGRKPGGARGRRK